MSLKIIKAGVLDTIQDTGRYGYQKFGINPGGAMDRFSSQLSNCLLGKSKDSPVVEMHFPAPIISFQKATIICLAGADFCACINDKEIPLYQPVAINKESILSFKRKKKGARCYLSILQKIILPKWLNSYSTNLLAEAGGFKGRKLRTGDVLQYERAENIQVFLDDKSCKLLPYKAIPHNEISTDKIHVIKGNEWHWLTEESSEAFLQNSFSITNQSNRMAYRLKGEKLAVKHDQQLVSSGVSFGNLQLLPSGQIILLMADHQTTGGYPRIAHVISAHLPQLAQMNPEDKITFCVTDIQTAEAKLLAQQQYLSSIEFTAYHAIKNIL